MKQFLADILRVPFLAWAALCPVIAVATVSLLMNLSGGSRGGDIAVSVYRAPEGLVAVDMNSVDSELYYRLERWSLVSRDTIHFYGETGLWSSSARVVVKFEPDVHLTKEERHLVCQLVHDQVRARALRRASRSDTRVLEIMDGGDVRGSEHEVQYVLTWFSPKWGLVVSGVAFANVSYLLLTVYRMFRLPLSSSEVAP